MTVIPIERIQKARNKFLDQEELKTLSFIRNHKPEWEELYIMNLQLGRRGIFQRLFQALIREGIIDEARVTWLEEPRQMIYVQLSSGKAFQVDVKKHSLGRFDLEGDVVIDSPQATTIFHPVELLDLLRQEGVLEEAQEHQFQRFKLEIQNGAANFALALTGAKLRKKELIARARSQKIHTSLEWVTKQCKEHKNFSPLAFYEQWVVEGHPLHPGAKTKFGLDVLDVIEYSPEWGAVPKIAFAAVLKENCQTSSMDAHTVTTLLYKEYEGLQSTVEKVLDEKGLDPAQFELIPVHPWQFDHTLISLYKEEIEQRKIVLISEFHIPAQSLVSFRSLAPIQNRGQNRHHIKTAVNVQTTSAIRTVSPNSVENGPVLSEILAKIQERENHFGGNFVVLKERAGAYFQPKNQDLSEDRRWKLQANLASILRENPENYIKKEEEIPMAAAALLADSPISGKPIAIELIKELAAHYQLSSLTKAACIFIEKYAETSLPGFFTLMVRYGISLEGHMQNSVSVFYKGELVRMLLRDFGGIRIYTPRLMREGFQPRIYPGSSIVTDKVEQLRNIISYSVLQNHFAELITCIVRYLGMDEKELWKQVVTVIRSVFTELKKDPEIREQAAEDERALFQPMIDLKALTTMRLRGDVTVYPFIKVPNPIAEWKGELPL
ncbi:IucA/IucC family protein [Neobacillus kokaensis]|uniref:Siderophore biosynthesis protein, IucA/IucC family n=1 Tax=Neobacillus kokaensis TaxID=2759023 RepID=A0ABQ3N812_9BACI|nr:IucA/IucC family protein [Neobacillus kokaensis]GHH99642.1 siderophore biosynthesis protein, IucA/IucC family [Neobacillus kokaensis]